MSTDRVRDNPFYVLELPVTATSAEVERAGQKLLAQLAIGVSAAATYRTPLGTQPRDETRVRVAVATLRDPQERVLWELWMVDCTDAKQDEPLPPWREALRSIGWRYPWG